MATFPRFKPSKLDIMPGEVDFGVEDGEEVAEVWDVPVLLPCAARSWSSCNLVEAIY